MNPPGFGLVMLLVLFVPCGNVYDQEIVKGKKMLDVRETATLRKLVYTKGLITSHEVSKSGVAYRVLAVPSEFETLHKKKRGAVLQLLLEIVKGARPQDALSAAAFAVALEDNPISAACYVDWSRDDFDDDAAESGKTPRTRLVVWLEKTLADAEKK